MTIKDRDGNEWRLVPVKATDEMTSAAYPVARMSVRDAINHAIAAAPQFVPAEVTDAAARKVFNAWIDARWRLNEGQDAKYGHAMIAVVREELGPALGLVAIREPTHEEFEQICAEYHGSGFDRELGVRVGRNMFDAVRAAMFPKIEGVL